MSFGTPLGAFKKYKEVKLTEAGLDYYTANASPVDARWLFGGRPRPSREVAAGWRGRIIDSQASGWDSDNEDSKGYVSVQWPQNTISYSSGIGRMIGYGEDRTHTDRYNPPINYIELARKPPKSATKIPGKATGGARRKRRRRRTRRRRRNKRRTRNKRRRRKRRTRRK